jgi:hypothetical protein
MFNFGLSNLKFQTWSLKYYKGNNFISEIQDKFNFGHLNMWLIRFDPYKIGCLGNEFQGQIRTF